MKIISHTEKANKFRCYLNKYYNENKDFLLVNLSETDNIKKRLPLCENESLSFLKMLKHGFKLWKDFFNMESYPVCIAIFGAGLSLLTLNNLKYQKNTIIDEPAINIMMLVILLITIFTPLIIILFKEITLFFILKRKQKKGINIKPLLAEHITEMDTPLYVYKELKADKKTLKKFKQMFAYIKLEHNKYTYYQLIEMIS